jgi:hypothetical protein
MLVFSVFKSNLGLFLELSPLVLVLEDQMLKPLFVDLDLDLVLLLQILVLAFFVAQLGLFVFQLLLTYQPKVINAQTFVVVETDKIFLFLNELFEVSALDS